MYFPKQSGVIGIFPGKTTCKYPAIYREVTFMENPLEVSLCQKDLPPSIFPFLNADTSL